MIPTKDQAFSLLYEAEKSNPGQWIQHSKHVGDIAKRIGSEIKNIDPDLCLIFGILHDIGRRNGITNIRHSYDGFEYLKSLGYDEAGRYCITHCFPGNKAYWFSENDLKIEEKNWVIEYLTNNEINMYDKIIQMADFISSPEGPIVLECRLIESGLRNAKNIQIFRFWMECIKIKDEINSILGYSVYKLFEEEIKKSLFDK